MSTPSPFLTYNASKSVPIEALPPEAWRDLTGAEPATPTARQWETVGWLHRCINIRANGLVRVPYSLTGRGGEEIWRSTDKTPLPQPIGWLRDLPFLFSLTETALCLVGESFWMKEKNRVRIVNLRWLAPQTMTPIWDEEKGLTAFERRIGGQKRDLQRDEIVYFALPNPLHETKPGPAPAMAAAAAAGVLYNIDAFASAFFERGAIKATLLTVEGNPPKAEVEKLEAWWKRFFSGNKNAYQSAAVRAGVTPVVVGEGLESLANQALTTEKRQDIATALGIPHSLVFSDAANYATAEQDELNFLNYTILPSARMIENAVNRQLLEPMGYGMRFHFENMDAFQVDETQRASSLYQLRQAGMPMETALAVLGYEIPEGLPIEEEAPELPEPTPPAAQQDEAPAESEDEDEVKADLGRWKRKALKALAAGKSADVAFESEHIPAEQAELIGWALGQAETEQEVKAAFEPLPFLWEGYP